MPRTKADRWLGARTKRSQLCGRSQTIGHFGLLLCQNAGAGLLQSATTRNRGRQKVLAIQFFCRECSCFLRASGQAVATTPASRRPSRFGLQRYARDPLKLSKRAQQLIRFDNVMATIIETHIDDSTPAVLCHCAAIAPRPTGTA